MNYIAIISNSDFVVKDIMESFKIIADIHFDHTLRLEIALDFIREKQPELVFFAEDLSMEEMVDIQKKIRKDSLVQHIPIIFLCQAWNPQKMDWMIRGKLVDDWIPLNFTISERLFRLNKHLEHSAFQKELHRLKMEYDYVSAELVYFIRSEQKEQRKVDKAQLVEIIDIMHYVRTFLTGIKGGASIFFGPESSDEQKKEAMKIIQKNIEKMDDYINKNDLTVKNEFRKKPPIKIIPLEQLIEAISPKIYLAAQKKKVTVIFEKSDQSYSVLLRNPEIMPATRTALVNFVNASSPGSSIEIGLEPLFSANLLRVYAKNISNRVDRTLLHHLLDEGYEWVDILNDAESKFELFSDSLYTGIQFYIPRLD